MSKSVLVVGGGGREHALVWKLAESHHVGKLYVAAGNGGTHELAENVSINATDTNGLARFAEKNNIHLTVVGQDDSLELGIVDTFRSRGLRIFGPTRNAAKIEWSKAFAKELMLERSVPTAGFRIFRKYSEAVRYVRKQGVPIVVKPSGLTFGKGPRVCRTIHEAEELLWDIMYRSVYGSAGDEVVVEDFLFGQEVSMHVFCDGKNYALQNPSSAQDHKLSHDDGSKDARNTGGMGTVAPVPWFTKEMELTARIKIIDPVLGGLAERGCPFTGLLYPGLILTKDGLKVLEFNARFGDPETQSFMRLLKTDLLEILEACVGGTLHKIGNIERHPGFAVCVVLASAGYPGEYKKGLPIRGIEEARRVPGVVIFHAGTSRVGRGWETSGGRVLGVSAVGDTLEDALDRAYEAVKLIHFEGMHYRRDIGQKAFVQI